MTTAPARSPERAQTHRRLTEIARTGEHLAALELACRWLATDPGDADARRAAATLAESQGLASVAADLRSEPAQPTRDTLTIDELIERAQRHAGLIDRLDLDPQHAADSLRDWRFARTDNATFWRPPRGVWRRVPDRAAIDAAMPDEAWAAHGIIIEGLLPPVLAQAALDRLPSTDLGYRPGLHIVQADPAEFIAGLGLLDTDKLITDPRVTWHVGPEATKQLTDLIRSKGNAPLPKGIAVAPGTVTRTDPTPDAIVQAASNEQTREIDRLRPIVHGRDRERGSLDWAKRFADITNGRERLRALVISSRFSTFVGYSAEDITDALRDLGHEAELLVEPAQDAKLGTGDLLAACARIDPDLIILINHTRWQTEGALPPGVPLLCWVQDAMGQLLAKIPPGALSPRDYFAGHVLTPMFDEYGYPRERMMPCGVPASRAKFTGLKPRRDNFDAEMIFVSNHGASADALRATLQDELSKRRLPEQVVDALDTAAQRALDDPHLVIARFLKRACRDAERTLRLPPSSGAAHQFYGLIAQPLAERRTRHRMLEQAIEICERHGWRLKIYGRGWAENERFAPYAAGIVEHGDQLREIYNGAAINLHASTTRGIHQRILECALAGGYTLSVRTHDLQTRFAKESARRAILAGVTTPEEQRQMDADIAADNRLIAAPESCEYLDWHQALAEADGAEVKTEIGYRARGLRCYNWLDDQFQLTPGDWPLDHPLHATFSNAQQFEANARAVIEHPEERIARIDANRERIERDRTYESVLNRLITCITRDLARAASPANAPTDQSAA